MLMGAGDSEGPKKTSSVLYLVCVTPQITVSASPFPCYHTCKLGSPSSQLWFCVLDTSYMC